jgi:hypothetical protein
MGFLEQITELADGAEAARRLRPLPCTRHNIGMGVVNHGGEAHGHQAAEVIDVVTEIGHLGKRDGEPPGETSQRQRFVVYTLHAGDVKLLRAKGDHTIRFRGQDNAADAESLQLAKSKAVAAPAAYGLLSGL